jgi:VWFA-related protein
MNKALSLLVLSAIAMAGAPAAAQRSAQATDARTRDIYVSVVDGKGNAVKGLSPKVFTVREDGVSREVLRAVPADAPLDIVLLVDDSQAATQAIPYLRDALTKFVDLMAGKARIGLVTVGERPTNITERTNDTAELKKGIGRIFARSGAGAYLLQGIVDVSRGFQLREAARPVIVAITMEGVEFSNEQSSPVLKELLASGATFHAIALGRPADVTSDEMRNRNTVIADGTEQTGGRREQLLTDMALPVTLERLADELLNQYVVTYSRPDTLVQPERIQVSVSGPDMKARARTRLPSK